jgi:hypothetical protein
VVLLSENISNTIRRFLLQIIICIGLTTSEEEKEELSMKFIEVTSHNHLGLPSPVSLDITGTYMPTGNSEVILAAVSKSPGHARNDAHIIGILSFRR